MHKNFKKISVISAYPSIFDISQHINKKTQLFMKFVAEVKYSVIQL